MDPEVGPLEALGSAIAQAHDEVVAGRLAEAHAAAREGLVEAAARQGAGIGRSKRVSLVAAAVVVVAAAGVIWAAWPERAAGPDAGGIGGETGQWLAAPSGGPLPVTLRDGTRLDLSARSRVRVEGASPAATRILLESGELHARMTPHAGARWRVVAGPFEVLVTGTEFTVSWNPEDERFELRLLGGSVDVRGPLLAEGRAVHAGQTVRVLGRSRLEVTENEPATPSVTTGPTTVASIAPVGSETRPPTPASPTTSNGGTIATTEPGSSVPAFTTGDRRPATSDQRPATMPTPTPTPTAAAEEWETLAAQRRYAEALDAARLQGLDGLCASQPVDGLVRLADAARYARDVDAATMVLQRIRDRFPGTTEAAEAAFKYGRVVSDVRGNALAAAAWFEIYLHEAPGGTFAREALGRLLEAYDGLGNVTAARRTAELYLARFPDGPHADLARRIVGR